MSAPIRVVVCDDQVLIRTGLVTIIGAQPDMDVPATAGTDRRPSTSSPPCVPTSW